MDLIPLKILLELLSELDLDGRTLRMRVAAQTFSPQR